MTEITRAELQRLYDFETGSHSVSAACAMACRDPAALLRFLGRYASWNGLFGAGVAGLAGKIGRSRNLFLDPAEAITTLADRSVLVASYFFDAARDEFDDRDTPQRDTHRCLAQAMIKGVIDYFAGSLVPFKDPEYINRLLAEPLWLQSLTLQVATGYGAASPDSLPAIFRAIGYHLGSEVLADQEFSLIDRQLRAACPGLVVHLQEHAYAIVGRLHQAYQWLSIHSGHGGAVEADHFAWATRGTRLAYQYVEPDLHAALRTELHAGFLQFSDDHKEFFANVNQG